MSAGVGPAWSRRLRATRSTVRVWVARQRSIDGQPWDWSTITSNDRKAVVSRRPRAAGPVTEEACASKR